MSPWPPLFLLSSMSSLLAVLLVFVPQDFAASLQHYASAVVAVPESTLYRTNHAVVQVELGFLEPALAEFKMVVALGAFFCTKLCFDEMFAVSWLERDFLNQ